VARPDCRRHRMKFHPDVLAAHAQFGGDLQSMQALYDRPDHIARIAALEAQLEHVTKKLNLAIAERDFWREADVNSQKQLFECKQSLVTPPAPKVTDEIADVAIQAFHSVGRYASERARMKAAITAAQVAGK
jgi:hypothetical protein